MRIQIKYLVLAGTALVIAACETTGAPSGGQVTGRPAGEGRNEVEMVADCASLVPISATSTQSGIAKEYKWIEENYPGSTPKGQALMSCNGGPVDVIQIETANGEIRNISFDISSFFGKVGGKDLDDLLDG